MSTDTVYLALYKGRRDGAWYRPGVAAARLSDWIIRTLTGSPYSHCELAVLVKPKSSLHPFGHTAPAVFDCYSSSIRDGGVRVKGMPLPADKWDLIPVRATEAQVRAAFETTRGAKYDWLGATGVITRWRHDKRKWFCSEWCAAALGLQYPDRYSPQALADWFRQPETAREKS